MSSARLSPEVPGDPGWEESSISAGAALTSPIGTGCTALMDELGGSLWFFVWLWEFQGNGKKCPSPGKYEARYPWDRSP